jgi:hypothetical protein
MKPVIEPLDREILERELSSERFVRTTNNSNNQIYIINAHNSPNVMLELGRVRELTFRNAGGGTGNEVDIDEYDTAEVPFEQLIVWNPEEREIIGAYRYILGCNIPFGPDGQPLSPTAHLFEYSKEFITNYLPYTIELGRSFVQTKYQPSVNPRKGLYALDNIWDGLGAVVVLNPQMKYFFGKMTMYNTYNREARDMILYVLKKHFGDTEKLVYPHEPQNIETPISKLETLFTGSTFVEDFKTLNTNVRAFNVNIPPLINIYMGLTPTMKCFGTSANIDFGEVEETAIMITVNDIYAAKKDRHINSFINQ